jgi:hypothetical protein
MESVAFAFRRGEDSDGIESSSSSTTPTGTIELARTIKPSLGDRLVVPATTNARD